MGETFLELLLQYGYIGIFLFLVLGIAGLPLPDEFMMTFIGYLTSIGKLNLTYTYLSAFLGSCAGITLSYILGKKLGLPFLMKYGEKIFITRRRLKMTQLLFRKYGSWLLFFGYFVPGVRHITAYIAGISNLTYYRFAIFAYIGAMFWCAVFIGLGHILGANWKMAFKMIHEYGLTAFLAILPLLLVGIGWWIWKRKKNFAGKT
ncbi:DedA family protein [Thermoflavimicrobium daqui]|uniref:Alkaline phosphatase n=1 Tax=Thermoflavimicrobium daqui TaxID=2137476 RepID=A0A364K6F1_9BACL|nr:DedA family protein [Thermoflavimicrobium daqui]RAL25891.1 alkaline phosphatase [Thermoflavimicrobium daqui]